MLVAAWSGLDQQISISLDTIYPTDKRITVKKMTGGTPEVRSDKSLTLLTFGPMDQWTNGPVFSLISKQKVLRARKGKPEHQKSSSLS